MQPVLRIDLSTGLHDLLDIPKSWEEGYLGGASLAARMLYEWLIPANSPFDEHTPLLFLTGPLTGTSGPAVGRFVICSRSPATGLWAESNCGGFWGPELRRAGLDGLLVIGCSDRPVYIVIRDKNIEIRSADHLWGLDTYTTQSTIENDLAVGKVRIAAIGPAGEARIPFALILVDHGRVAGRTGVGAVMGAKRLKAVVVQGHGSVPVYDLERYLPLRSEANRNLRDDPISRIARELGTASVADYFDYLGLMPKRYFQSSSFPDELEVTGPAIKDSILTGKSACHACVIACGRVVTLEDGEKHKGPEYETLVGFGPNLWLNDKVFATQMGELCDRYGMDSISLSNTLGLAILLFEKEIITERDTGGLHLRWGDKTVVEQLVHQTVRREGFGAWIAEGARNLARRFGVEDEAVQVNGLEVAYHDPRAASGMALVYATSPRGGCHNQSDYFMVELGQVETGLGFERFSPFAGGEKAANVALHQDWRTLFNSLVICLFANVPPSVLLELINAACPVKWEASEMMKAGERGWNLKRVINNRLGLRAEHDIIPKAFLVPYPDSDDSRDFVPQYNEMISAYYQARSWDPVTGFPSREKLKELDLGWAIDDLW